MDPFRKNRLKLKETKMNFSIGETIVVYEFEDKGERRTFFAKVIGHTKTSKPRVRFFGKYIDKLKGKENTYRVSPSSVGSVRRVGVYFEGNGKGGDGEDGEDGWCFKFEGRLFWSLGRDPEIYNASKTYTELRRGQGRGQREIDHTSLSLF